jgi:hypothetical protein
MEFSFERGPCVLSVNTSLQCARFNRRDQGVACRSSEPDDGGDELEAGPVDGGAFGVAGRDSPWRGYLVADVVHDNIAHVEVLYRSPLC